MTFPRIKLAGWGVNEKLTSAQMNALDIDHAAAVDSVQMALADSFSSVQSWPIKGTNTNNIKRGFYSVKDQAWFAVGSGGNNFLEVSYDYGRTWTDLSASVPGGFALFDVTAATTGDVCVIGASRTVHRGQRTAYGTYTWSSTALMLNAIPAGGACDYEATAAKFIAVYRTGAVGHADYTASPSTAWTAGTVAAAWGTYVGAKDPEVTAIPGLAIAAYVDATVPRLNIMNSTDGGANWNNVQKTLVMSAADCSANSTMSKPAYNAYRNEWYITVSTTTGTRRTEVYRSTDAGATWTLVVTVSADFVAQDLVAINDLLVMTNDDNRIAYSADRGATWKLATRLVGSAARAFIRAGGGGFMTWNSVDKTSLATVRTGDSGNSL
jgi:hypothetical protein